MTPFQPFSDKILIADDEPNILILMEQTLEPLEEEYGIELLTVANGVEAWEKIQQEKPCLVFLDVMMPAMSGIEVCQRVKAEVSLQEIHVIMLTAKGQELDRQHGMAVGADLYLTKPFRPREILEKSLDLLNLVPSSGL